MLQKTNPEILKVQEQIANIDALLEKGFPLTRQMQDHGYLNFNVVRSDCGSYRCLAGWSDTVPELRGKFGIGEDLDGTWKYDGFEIGHQFGIAANPFGTDCEVSVIFGNKEAGGLGQRENYVRGIVRPRLVAKLNALLSA